MRASITSWERRTFQPGNRPDTEAEPVWWVEGEVDGVTVGAWRHADGRVALDDHQAWSLAEDLGDAGVDPLSERGQRIEETWRKAVATADSPDDYRRLRESIGTQEAAAAKLGVARNTIARRERGEIPIDDEAMLAMRHVAECGE